MRKNYIFLTEGKKIQNAHKHLLDRNLICCIIYYNPIRIDIYRLLYFYFSDNSSGFFLLLSRFVNAGAFLNKGSL